MASALAAGGLPEEAPPLLAKALRCLVAARREAGGEGAADPSLADPEALRSVAMAGALSRDLATALAAVRSPSAAPSAADATDAAARLIATLWPPATAVRANSSSRPQALVA